MHYLLYGHGGSYNHGCEALSRCTIALLRRISPGCRITLSTHFAEQDRQFKLDADELVERDMGGQSNEAVYAPTFERITPDSICIHLGGDNYCYRNWQRYAAIHYKAIECGAVSILWGCSIDPEAIDAEMLEVLRTHHLIAAREGITYKALIGRGLSNVVKVSDIAFTLEPEPVLFELNNFVALNISPLVIRKNPLVKAAFQVLVDYILSQTDMNIALVPHVVNPVDNDYDALGEVDRHGSDRVVLVSDELSAGQYKGIVSKARFCVTARTHLAIAAYSSCVPVLAIGYNSKSGGIAADLDMGEYVVNAEHVANDLDIANTFCRLVSNESDVISRLKDKMPEYIRGAASNTAIRAFTGRKF